MMAHVSRAKIFQEPKKGVVWEKDEEDADVV